MKRQTIDVTIGCLLHDIGKLVYRADSASGNHSDLGYSFIKSIDAFKNNEAVLDCIRYHHSSAIRDSNPKSDNICYISYIADNISASADRRETSDEGNFDRYLPLSPVFTHLNGEHPGYSLSPSTDLRLPDIPLSNTNYRLTSGNYNEIISGLKRELSALSPEEEWINSILSVLEAYTSHVTSSTNTKESADVSLYDHVKISAAVGACISEYLISKGLTDYKKCLFNDEKSFDEEKAFILYSADYSGIQKFIYTVSTKKALKSLRSRSFFLEMSMEHYIDELLLSCGLSRANLLYSGGGHCYILLPNVETTLSAVNDWNTRFNDWLLDEFGVSLYLASGYTECSANDLTNVPSDSSPYKEIFRRVSAALSKDKLCRYSTSQIRRINTHHSYDSTRECSVCGRSDILIKDADRFLCSWCSTFENLSGKIQSKNIFIVSNNDDGISDFSVPSLEGKAFFTLTDINSAREKLTNSEGIRRVYSKNDFHAGLKYCSHISVGDYAMSNELEELANASSGVSRLGICRMDVDNLGQAFVSGFESPSGTLRSDKRGFVTISRTASFSRQLSNFFKSSINSILDGTYNHQRPLNVSIIYSGGDDVFLVGSWDDTIDAAKRIHDTFAAFTCGALTISCGVLMVDSHFPIRLAAERAAELEDESKSNPSKDSISLFEVGGNHSYSWCEYTEHVEKTKLLVLDEFFLNDENGRGNAFLYRMTELLREANKRNGNSIHLARYAYMLARLEPKDSSLKAAYKNFSTHMYDWSLSRNDRKQLLTAILLHVYKNRERG